MMCDVLLPAGAGCAPGVECVESNEAGGISKRPRSARQLAASSNTTHQQAA